MGCNVSSFKILVFCSNCFKCFPAKGQSEARYLLFNWAWGNLVKGGYILINNSVVDDFIDIQPKAEIKRLNEYDNTELWKNPHQNRLNTKTLVKRIKNLLANI